MCLGAGRRRSADIGRLRQIGFRDAHTTELSHPVADASSGRRFAAVDEISQASGEKLTETQDRGPVAYAEPDTEAMAEMPLSGN